MERIETANTSDPVIGRRSVMKGTAALGLAGFSGACTGLSSSSRMMGMGSFAPVPAWMNLLHKSEQGGRDYEPRIEGSIPAGLRGSLYRNGPGLFERGGSRIAHLLDGDGLVQKLQFSDGGVRYKNRFVQTEKFKLEERTGRREFSTWTTHESDTNIFRNMGAGIKSQAGVTVYPVHGRILARDEVGPSYEMDEQTLDTLGELPVGEGLDSVLFKAHLKVDPDNGESVFVGVRHGRKMSIHAAIYDRNMKLRTQFSFPSPRQAYFHDYLLTKNHIIVNLNPCFFSPYSFLLGRKTFVESLSWKGEQGNLVAVVPRYGGEPRYFEAPGSFMWHALNAYEEGNEIMADFVSYDAPDHFMGDNALFYNIMHGRSGNSEFPGKIRRYAIDLGSKRIREEIVVEGNHEFPMIDLRMATKRHRVGYFASSGAESSFFHSGLTRLDYNSGSSEMFDFGPMVQVGEPIFAPLSGGGVDEGWLLTECLDGSSQKTFFAIFDAQSVGKGPVSKVWLSHHVPISFHGGWQA